MDYYFCFLMRYRFVCWMFKEFTRSVVLRLVKILSSLLIALSSTFLNCSSSFPFSYMFSIPYVRVRVGQMYFLKRCAFMYGCMSSDSLLVVYQQLHVWLYFFCLHIVIIIVFIRDNLPQYNILTELTTSTVLPARVNGPCQTSRIAFVLFSFKLNTIIIFINN